MLLEKLVLYCWVAQQAMLLDAQQEGLSHYCIRTLPRGGRYWVVHPRRPRDFPRA